MQQLSTLVLGLSEAEILAPSTYKYKMWFGVTAEILLLIILNGSTTIAYAAIPE